LELSNIFGVIGIAVSFLFGVWGVYLAYKNSKSKASLAFVHEQVIGLFDDVASKLPNLSITYKNKQIDNKVILLNGYIANDGGKDISRAMVEKTLSAVLPDKWKWLECKILSAPEDLNITSDISSDNELCFEFGLFRKGESFSFQALISIDDEINDKKTKLLVDKIDWNHRISDLGKIVPIDLPYEKKSLFRYIVPIGAGLTYIVMSIFVLLSSPFERPVINYMVPIDGKYTEVKFIPEFDGSAKLEAIEIDHEETVDLQEYFSITKISPKISHQKNSENSKLIMFFVTLFGGIFMLYMGLEKDFKKWKVRKLIAASNKPNKAIKSDS